MNVNKTELQWEACKEEDNRKWDNTNQYFNCSRQPNISLSTATNSVHFSELQRQTASAPHGFRSILLRLGEDQYFRKVCALATEGYPISGKSMVSWGHCLTSEARWGHSLSATPGSSWEVKFEVSRAPCMLAWSHHSDAAQPSRREVFQVISSIAAPHNTQWHEGLY